MSNSKKVNSALIIAAICLGITFCEWVFAYQNVTYGVILVLFLALIIYTVIFVGLGGGASVPGVGSERYDHSAEVEMGTSWCQPDVWGNAHYLGVNTRTGFLLSLPAWSLVIYNIGHAA